MFAEEAKATGNGLTVHGGSPSNALADVSDIYHTSFPSHPHTRECARAHCTTPHRALLYIKWKWNGVKKKLKNYLRLLRDINKPINFVWSRTLLGFKCHVFDLKKRKHCNLRDFRRHVASRFNALKNDLIPTDNAAVVGAKNFNKIATTGNTNSTWSIYFIILRSTCITNSICVINLECISKINRS